MADPNWEPPPKRRKVREPRRSRQPRQPRHRRLTAPAVPAQAAAVSVATPTDGSIAPTAATVSPGVQPVQTWPVGASHGIAEAAAADTASPAVVVPATTMTTAVTTGSTESKTISSAAPASAIAALAMEGPRQRGEGLDTEDPTLIATSDTDTYLGKASLTCVGIRYYNGWVSEGENVIFQREPTNAYDQNAIQVLNVVGHQVGHVKATQARILAPLMDRLILPSRPRLEGRVLTPGDGYTIPLLLEVYGSHRHYSAFSRALTKLPGGRPAADDMLAQAEVHTTVREAVKLENELDTLYSGRAEYETMPEAPTPLGMMSTLYPHQAKALHWMLRRERTAQLDDMLRALALERDNAAGVKAPGQANVPPITYQLWQKKVAYYYNVASRTSLPTAPPIHPGGILADDMVFLIPPLFIASF